MLDASETIYKVIKSEASTSFGWTVLNSSNNNEDWNIAWVDSYVSEESLRRLLPYQKINHFPASYQLGKKNFLA